MKQKLNTLNKNSKVIDILKDRDFLRLFRVFILEYSKDNKEENVEKLVEQFSSKTYLQDFQNKNENNLFLQFEKFFSDSVNLTIFLEFLKNYNIDEKLLNVFLEVGEFLQNISFNKGKYLKEFYNISDNYKTKIIDIIGKKPLENIKFLLTQENYPLLSPFNFEIIDANFGNYIDYNSLNGVDRFIWCKDLQNNVFYQNSLGEILRDSENKIITSININSIKNFGEYRVYSFKNEDGNNKIQIEPSLAFGVNFNNNIKGDFFNIKEISYREEILDENNEIIEIEETLDYLLINDGEEKRLLNENLEEISILDLLKFLNKNNPLTSGVLEKTLDRLSDIGVSEIHKIYNYKGVKFIELTCEIDLDLGYDEDEIELEDKHIVLLDNGKPLVVQENYIYSLGEQKDFLGKTFVSFSLTKIGGIDGYIDSFGKVLKIGDERIFDIKKLPFRKNGEIFYKINDKNNFIISEKKLLIILYNYSGFDEIGTEFEIGMDDGESIELDGKKYEKIIGILKDDGELDFYLFDGKSREKIEYNFLLENLRKTDFGNKALKILNQTLNLLEII